jgi:flagella basal body P-ring formation protein FlgA
MLKIVFFIICYFTQIEFGFSAVKDHISQELTQNFAETLAGMDFEVRLNSFPSKLEKISQEKIILKEAELNANKRNFNGALEVEGMGIIKISGQILLQTEIPVLKKPLGAGEVITPQDVIWIKYGADKISPSMVTQSDDLVGKTARHGILKMNTPLFKSALHKPVVIKKGESVKVVYKSPAIEVANILLAKTEGSVGDIVTFETIPQTGSTGQTKKLVQARVVGPGEAEIMRPS